MPNPQPDPDAISISGHFTGQGWYRSEDRAMPVISMPILSPKSVRKAADWSREKPRNRRFNSPRFLRFPVMLSLEFCSPRFPLYFPTNHSHRGEPICRWSVIEGFTALGARSGAITTRERSPPPPLDSARPKVSNSSFPSPSVEIRSPLVGMGISVMFTWMQLKLI